MERIVGTGFTFDPVGPEPAKVSAGAVTKPAPSRAPRDRLTEGQVVSGLTQRGVPEHVAEGVVKNFRDESGLKPGIQEHSPTSGRGGFGLAQWTGPRRRNLEKFAASQGKAVNDPDVQLDFFMAENAGPERGAWSKVMASPTKEAAAAAFVTHWERPAEKYRAARVAKYTGGGGDDTLSGGAGTDTLTTSSTKGAGGMERILVNEDYKPDPDTMGDIPGVANFDPAAAYRKPINTVLATPDDPFAQLNADRVAAGKKPLIAMPAPDYDKWKQKFDANQPGVLSDVGNLLDIGWQGIATSIDSLINIVPGGEYITAGTRKIDEWLTGRPTPENVAANIKEDEGQLSAKTQAARKKNWYDDETGKLGDAWTDPRAYMSGLVESIPATLLTMGPTGLLWKGAYAGAIARGMTEEAASALAAKTALRAGGISEGALSGGSTADQVRQELSALPQDVWDSSEAYQALIKQGVSPEAAKESIIDSKSAQAGIMAGVSTGLVGGRGDMMLANIFTKGLKGGLKKRLIKGAAKEAGAEALEETVQSTGEQVSTNVAVGGVDPNRPLSKGVVDAALGGAVTGGLMGGGMGAVGGAVSPEGDAPPPPPANADPRDKGLAAGVDAHAAGPLESAVRHGATELQATRAEGAAGRTPPGAPPVGSMIPLTDDEGNLTHATIVDYDKDGAVVDGGKLGSMVIPVDELPKDIVPPPAPPAPAAPTGIAPGDVPPPTEVGPTELPGAKPTPATTTTTLPPKAAQKPALDRFPGPPPIGQRVIVDAPGQTRTGARVEAYDGDDVEVSLPDGSLITIPLKHVYVDKRTKAEIEAEEPPPIQHPKATGPLIRDVTTPNKETRQVEFPDDVHGRLFDLGMKRQQAKKLGGTSQLDLDQVDSAGQQKIADDLKISLADAGMLADDYRYHAQRHAGQAKGTLPTKMYTYPDKRLKRAQREHAEAQKAAATDTTAGPPPTAAVDGGAAVEPTATATAPLGDMATWWDDLTAKKRKQIMDEIGSKKSPQALWRRLGVGLQSNIAEWRRIDVAAAQAESEEGGAPAAAPAPTEDTEAAKRNFKKGDKVEFGTDRSTGTVVTVVKSSGLVHVRGDGGVDGKGYDVFVPAKNLAPIEPAAPAQPKPKNEPKAQPTRTIPRDTTLQPLHKHLTIDFGIDSLVLADPKGDAAKAELLKRGKPADKEQLIAIDINGDVVANRQGSVNGVNMGGPLWGILTDPKERVVFQHTHPRSSPPSLGDVATSSLQGVVSLYAHAHDGSHSYRIAMRPAAKAFLLKKHAKDLAGGYITAVTKTLKKHQTAFIAAASRAVTQGMSNARTLENNLNHIHLMAMRDAGWLDYDADGRPEATSLQNPAIKEAYDKLVADLAKQIRTGSPAAGHPLDVRHPGELARISGRDESNAARPGPQLRPEGSPGKPAPAPSPRPQDAAKPPEKVAPPAPAPAPAPAPPSTAPKAFSADDAAKAKALLLAKFKKKPPGEVAGEEDAGLDPETEMAGLAYSGHVIEEGARSFEDYARAMLTDLGDEVRPYLQGWYLTVRFHPKSRGFSSTMTSAAQVEGFELDKLVAAPEPAPEPVPLPPRPAPEPESPDHPNTEQPDVPEPPKVEPPPPAPAPPPSTPPEPAPPAGFGTPDNPNVQALGAAYGEFFSSPVNRFDTIVQARKFAEERLGGPVVPGTMGAKQVDEAVELGVVIAAMQIVQASNKQNRPESMIFDRLRDLYARQPNLNVRTSTSIANQAYSTPAPLAYLASRLAGITTATSVLEPTAGNGMLLIEAAKGHHVSVNELDPSRAANLTSLGFHVTQNDASDSATKLRHSGYPVDVVIANPPFGTVQDATGYPKQFKVDERYTTDQIDHAIALRALAHMKDDGTAVLIVGSISNQAASTEDRAKAYSTKAKRAFYYTLYNGYNVVDHFTVAGNLYEKQGAGWPVDVIVIRGKGKSARGLPAAELPNVLNSWDEVARLLDGQAAGPAVGPPDQAPPRAPGGGTRGGNAGSRAPVRGPRVPPVERPGGQAPAGPVRGGSPGGERSPAGSDQQPSGGVPDSAGSSDTGDTGGRAPVDRETAAPVDTTQKQITYIPRSGLPSMNTLVPVNMVDAAQAALDALEDRVGDIDQFVMKELQYSHNVLHKNFGAEQIDGIALAIDNFKRGAGLVIGDQTGIGKGRQVAAILRWARLNGKTPIFVTMTPTLYRDMYRDLTAIGEDNPRIFMTNANESVPLNEEETLKIRTPDARAHNAAMAAMMAPHKLTEADLPEGMKLFAPGEIISHRPDNGSVAATQWVVWVNPTVRDGMTFRPINSNPTPYGEGATREAALEDYARKNNLVTPRLGDYDYIFTTYSQMQTVQGQTTTRQAFLRAMTQGGVIAFDESHNAGGQEAGGRPPDPNAPPTRAGFARELVGLAGGVLYSSATYAKRPGVMDLYSKTDMRLAVGDVSELGPLITKGGVPMQQIVAAMLARAGQYVRRERTFDGVVYDTAGAAVDHAVYEAFSTAIKRIQIFSETHVKPAVARISTEIRGSGDNIRSDGSTGQAGAKSTNFTSVMHNTVSQFLLAIKADIAADMAIETLKAGEKPVLTVANTMESFINDVAEDLDLKVGDATSMNFRNLLLRYLERARTITITDPFGNKRKHVMTDRELGPAATAFFNQATELIEAGAYGSLPASPIDWIKYRIKQAGYSAGEITGRETIIDYRADGQGVINKRGKAAKSITGKIKAINAFNGGKLDVLILNQSGSTGLSLHASIDFKDTRRRHMIIVQAEANIDTHMQMLGRVHRTGQVITPRYSQLVADVPAEKRPASVLAKKMASLNANTTASRGSALTAKDVPDFMNEYGDRVAAAAMMDHLDLHLEMGSPLRMGTDGFDEADAMKSVTGRIPLLTKVQTQQDLYDILESAYLALIEQLEATGGNVLEAKTLPLEAKTTSRQMVKAPSTVHDSPFADGVWLDTVDVKAIGKPMKPAEVLGHVADTVGATVADVTPANAKNILSTLQRQGEDWMEKLSAKTLTDFRAYKIVALDQIDDVAARSATDTALNDVRVRWQALADKLSPGAGIKVMSANMGNFYGVVLDVKRTGKAKNPMALGSWTVKIAMADASREMTIPFSQLYTARTAPTEPGPRLSEIDGSNEAHGMPMLEAFENMQAERREQRTIVTGNILAGFDAVDGKGQIINYTDSDGRLKQGIMMARTFNAAKFLKNKPVKFYKGGEVVQFLNALRTSTVRTISSLDDFVKVIKLGSGNFRIITDKTKGRGGRYFLNKDVLHVAGQEFIKVGGKMRMDVSPDRIDGVVQALMDAGAMFEATEELETARKVMGILPPAEPEEATSEREEKLPSGYQTDNPGGRWLEGKQRVADKDIADGNHTGLYGSTTASAGMEKPLYLPVSELKQLPGRHNEQPAPGKAKYDDLLQSVEAKGYTNENPVFVMVNHKGQAFINEGNNRTAVAAATGVESVKAWVHWRNGGELAEGPWSPANVAAMEVEPEVASEEDATIPAASPISRVRFPKQKDFIRAIKGKWTDFTPTALKAVYLNYFPELAPAFMKPAVELYLRVKRKMDTYRSKMHAEMDGIVNEWLKYARLGTAKIEQLADLMHDARVAGVDPDGIEDIDNPDWRDLRARFDAMPEAGKALYRKVRDAYVDNANELDDILIANLERSQSIAVRRANAMHAERKADIRRRHKNGDLSAEDAEAEEKDENERHTAIMDRGRWRGNSRVRELRLRLETSRVQGAYFPLGRFGKYFVAVRDKDGKLEAFAMRETDGAARKLQDEYKAAYPGRDVTSGALDVNDKGIRDQVVKPQFIADIEQMLTEANPGNDDAIRDSNNQIIDQIWQRYLRSLPELSTRKRAIHASKVPGFDRDAMRVFAHHMFHAAHQMARLKHGLELTEALDNVKATSKEDPDNRTGTFVANEMNDRHKWVMNPQGKAWTQVAASAAFTYYLAASPAAALVNTLQTPMVGIPILGARFGSRTKAAAAILQAAKDVLGRNGAGLTKTERDAMKEWEDSGLIDRTQSHDIAGVGETGVYKYRPRRAQIMKGMTYLFHKAEVANRRVTALAAYRMARAGDRGQLHEDAVNTASDLTWKVHFDYSNSSRPTYMQQDWQKVMLSLRSYQINMLYRLGRDFVQMLNKGATPAERKEARMQFGGMVAMQALIAGTSGIIGYNTVFMLYGIAATIASALTGGDDEDDPFDAAQQFRAGIMDLFGPQLGGMLLDGIPGHFLGVDLTSRVGMADLWLRSPNKDLQDGSDRYYYILDQLAGAPLGIVKQVLQGYDYLSQDKKMKALEALSPKVLKDLLKMYDYGTQGVTDVAGNEVVSREDLSYWDLIAQGAGFTPATVGDKWDEKSALKNAESRIKYNRQAYINAFGLAAKYGDQEGMDDALANIDRFNRSKFGATMPISSKTLQRSIKQKAILDIKRARGGGVLIQNEELGRLLREELPEPAE